LGGGESGAGHPPPGGKTGGGGGKNGRQLGMGGGGAGSWWAWVAGQGRAPARGNTFWEPGTGRGGKPARAGFFFGGKKVAPFAILGGGGRVRFFRGGGGRRGGGKRGGAGGGGGPVPTPAPPFPPDGGWGRAWACGYFWALNPKKTGPHGGFWVGGSWSLCASLVGLDQSGPGRPMQAGLTAAGQTLQISGPFEGGGPGPHGPGGLGDGGKRGPQAARTGRGSAPPPGACSGGTKTGGGNKRRKKWGGLGGSFWDGGVNQRPSLFISLQDSGKKLKIKQWGGGTGANPTTKTNDIKITNNKWGGAEGKPGHRFRNCYQGPNMENSWGGAKGGGGKGKLVPRRGGRDFLCSWGAAKIVFPGGGGVFGGYLYFCEHTTKRKGGLLPET